MDGLTDAVNNLIDSTKAMASGGNETPEGLTAKDKSLQDSLNSLDGAMKELAKSIITLNTSTIDLKDSNDEESKPEDTKEKSFLESLKDEFSGIFSELGSSLFGTGKDKKGIGSLGDKKANKAKPKAEDLLQLSERDALGSLLIASKLDELIGSNKKKGDESGGGLGDVFKGLLKGVAGIALLAVALVIFAGAAILFSFVNWGPALVGLVMFAGFVVGAIVIAKLMGANLKAFADLALGSLLLAAGLAVFALALVITAWSANLILSMGIGGIGGIIIILAMYAGFVVAASALGNLLGENTKYLKDLAIGGLLLSIGLMVFSVALVVVSFLADKIDIVSCLGTLVLFGAFVLSAALIGKLLGENSKAIKDLAIGSILLSVGLVVFALALLVVQEIAQRVDLVNNVFPTLGLFVGFVMLMAVLGKLIEKNISSVIMVAVGSLIMTASLMLFALTLKYINDNITNEALVRGLITLGMMAGFILAFGLIGFAIVSTQALIFIAVTTVAILGISLALYAFSGVLGLIKEINLTQKDYLNSMLVLGLAGAMMMAMIPLGALSLVALPATLLFAIWSASAAIAFNELNSVINVLTKGSFIEGIKKADSFLVSKDGITVGKFINDVMDSLPNPIMTALFAIKMGLFESLTFNMAKSFLSMQKVIDSIEYIRNRMPSDADMEPVLTLMERVINVTSRAIESVKGASAKALQAIGDTVRDVCLGIDTLSNVIIKLKSIKQSDVIEGSENIRLMITNLFGTEENGLWTITTLFKELKRVGKGSGPAAEALVPITTAISSLSETVKSLVGIQGLDEGIANTQKVGELMAKLAVIFGESAGDTGGWFKSSSSEKLAEAKKSFDEIGNIITGPVKVIASSITSLDNINGLGKKLENILPSDVEGFSSRMKKFEDGTKNFKKGVENFDALNNVKVDKLDIIKTALQDISKITMIDTLRPLTELLNRTKDLEKVKNTLEEIAKISKKNESLNIATVQAAPKMTGNESVRDIVALIYQQMFEGSGVKIGNWPTMETAKGITKDTITPVQNFL